MEIAEQIKSAPTRAKLVVIVELARLVCDAIEEPAEARSALELCWRWLAAPEKVSPAEIYATLESEDETGLLFSEYDTRKGSKEESAYLTVTTAVAYVCHSAYRDGTVPMPSSINEVTEDCIDDILSYLELAGIAKERINRVVNAVTNHHGPAQGKIGDAPGK